MPIPAFTQLELFHTHDEWCDCYDCVYEASLQPWWLDEDDDE